MSKIDSLLSLADSLSSKSDSMISSVFETNSLISLILELNGSIAAADSEIDSMTELINTNNVCLKELEKLYEKSFFLESNLHLNQSYTNETSLDNLNKEYSYVLSSFGHHNICQFAEAELKPPPENKVLKSMLSISNLDLKPIRCRNAKVSKRKSRYRLSAAYTLNPLQETPIRSFLKSSNETNSSSLMENASHNSSASSVVDEETARSFGVASHATHEQIVQYELADDNLEDTFENEASPEKQDRLLTFGATSPVNLNSLDLDDLEEYDFDSSDSSPTSSDGVENFHKFLRQSRVDLRTAFPAPLQKSLSHDSVFSAVQIPTQPTHPPKFHNPALMLTSHAKETINQPTVETIYSSSSSKLGTSFELPPVVSNFREHSKRLLHDTLAANICETPTKHKPITPKRKSNFTLFSLLNSPMGSPSGFSHMPKDIPTEGNGRRRGSIDFMSKSLASGIFNLVGTTKNKVESPTGSRKAVHFSPPEKIKKLKKGIRDPIEIRNDIYHKRLPPSERHLHNGSHSSLIIGPGKQKIINHGETSIFKRPTVRRMSQHLLQDALNESLLF